MYVDLFDWLQVKTITIQYFFQNLVNVNNKFNVSRQAEAINLIFPQPFGPRVNAFCALPKYAIYQVENIYIFGLNIVIWIQK